MDFNPAWELLESKMDFFIVVLCEQSGNHLSFGPPMIK